MSIFRAFSFSDWLGVLHIASILPFVVSGQVLAENGSTMSGEAVAVWVAVLFLSFFCLFLHAIYSFPGARRRWIQFLNYITCQIAYQLECLLARFNLPRKSIAGRAEYWFWSVHFAVAESLVNDMVKAGELDTWKGRPVIPISKAKDVHYRFPTGADL